MLARTLWIAAAVAVGTILSACGFDTSAPFSDKPYVVCNVDTHNLHTLGSAQFDTAHLKVGDIVQIGPGSSPNVELAGQVFPMSKSGSLVSGQISFMHMQANAAIATWVSLPHNVQIEPTKEVVGKCRRDAVNKIRIRFCYADLDDRQSQVIWRCGKTRENEPMHFGDIHAEN